MIETEILGVSLRFHTDRRLFSPDGVDKGTLAMLKAANTDIAEAEKLLDLGCGYGVVGIYAASCMREPQIIMSDSDARAVDFAMKNAALNEVAEKVRVVQASALRGIDEKDFSIILCNPPYHADFSIPKEFIEKGFNRLAVGGSLYMVTKRLTWYKNKLTAIFGGVKVTEAEGYFVFCAEKRRRDYAR